MVPSFKYHRLGTSPVIKWLRLCAPNAGGPGLILAQEARSHMWQLKISLRPGESKSGSVVSNPLRPQGLCSPWNSPGQNTGVGRLSLWQRIFPTQESNPGLLHCRWILYQLSHQLSPRILEWVAIPFSRGSSQPRNQTQVSCIAGRFFIIWVTREAHISASNTIKNSLYAVWYGKS